MKGAHGAHRLRFVSALAGVFAASCVLAPVALGAQSASQRADALLARITPSEKLSLVGSGRAGVPRLGIPSLSFVDGPNGIGEGSPRVTSFPNAVSIGASWDPVLAARYGAALGAEAAGKGDAMLAAPTINPHATFRSARA